MRMFRACLGFAVALGASSCSLHDHIAFDDAVNDAMAEVSAHEAALRSMPSMAAARDEIDRHATNMDAALRHIRLHLADVAPWCNDWDMDDVWSRLHAVEDRLDAYLADAGRMDEMPMLIAISQSYAEDMDHLLHRLAGQMDQAWCW